MLKDEFMRSIEILNDEAKKTSRRPNPKTQSSVFNVESSNAASRDAQLIRKGYQEATKQYENAKRIKWEVDHLNADQLKDAPTKEKAENDLRNAKKNLENFSKLADKVSNSLDSIGKRYERYSNYSLENSQFEFYLDKMLFPVAPGELEVKIKDKNEIIDLASGGEFIIPQKPGLTKITFTALLPAHDMYQWAQYKGGFKEPKYFLDKLEALKVSGKTADFAVIRNYNDNPDSDTYMKVKLGEYTIKEDASKNIDDVEVSIELIQDSNKASHEVKFAQDGKASIVKNRKPGEGKPKVPTTHKVTIGETLCEISRYYYGDSKYWENIAKSNNIKNPTSLKKEGKEYLWIGVIPGV